MMLYRLTNAAENDLAEIYEYSLLNFGRKVADDYLSGLVAAFELIVDNPKLGYKFQVFRGFRKGKHIVFYHPQSKPIAIVRIMHESMEHHISQLIAEWQE
ncbi:MAG: hypothetical protein CR975_03590 [Gammaproteobacteria bacterium]|nr:MAG: hypothetical protein CR975_03590 [Gammaproteobacteria bacterium]